MATHSVMAGRPFVRMEEVAGFAIHASFTPLDIVVLQHFMATGLLRGSREIWVRRGGGVSRIRRVAKHRKISGKLMCAKFV
jgi:hypothetical protein